MGAIISAHHETIVIDFTDTPLNGVVKSKWRKDAVSSVFKLQNGLTVIRTGGKDFLFGVESLSPSITAVSSVLDVTPENNEHLFELISSIVD